MTHASARCRRPPQAPPNVDDHITAVGLNCLLAFQDVERDRHSRPPHAEHQGQKVVR